MMSFDPNCLYSLDELRERLAGIVELPTLLDRLGLRDRRIFKGAVWGWEIIEASRKAGPFNEVSKPDAAVVEMSMRPGVRRAKATSKHPVRRLTARDLES
jgi:hypothetical protein